MNAPKNIAWQNLEAHAEDIKKTHLKNLFDAAPERAQEFSIQACGLHLDYSKNKVTQATLELLDKLARHQKLDQAIQAMFRGDIINKTEQRSVSHVALRRHADAEDACPAVHATLEKMHHFVTQVLNGRHVGYTGKPITDIVSIGIGGSFLGPKVVSEALKPFWQHKVKGHFIANVDGTAVHDKLARLNPETTLMIVASKSFSTQETLMNATAARAWLYAHGATHEDVAKHFIAVSSQVKKATAFGIHEDAIFPMWDWVGGRYSLWSAIGLPIALLIGMEHFYSLLAGAHNMDQHFKNAPLRDNIPMMMGMVGVWNHNFLGAQSHAILPYDHDLRALPAYIQQLDMESNGKSVTQSGTAIGCHTGPIIWGAEGSNGQHAFHQLLHQGTRQVTVDFILPLKSHRNQGNHHHVLASHCFAQSQALMQGRSYEASRAELKDSQLTETQKDLIAHHKAMPGDKPSSTLLLNQITPISLGALIAAYEHKTFVQSIIWDINAFDQWGVELGKDLSSSILKQIEGQLDIDDMQDASTKHLIGLLKQQHI